MSKRAIIIDTDPGIDDAVALAIALHSEELDIRLITTVAGNVGLDKTTANALKILKFYGKSIPVAQGAKVPLIRTPVEAKSVHGESGMDGWDFEPGDERNLTKENAVDAMYKVIMSSKEPITLVPIAPLTNIALLFETYPEVKTNIKEIIMMGGSLTRGNFGVMSEFNIGADPEAAKMVFAAGVPLTMVGLDVGWKALIYPEDTAKIKKFGKSGEMIHALFSHYRQNGMKNGLKMYDACALAYLLKPEMFQVESCFADVETKGELTYGCTVCDLKNYLKKEKNITVTTDINASMFTDWLLGALQKMAR